MTSPAVEIEYLRKRYGSFEALAGVSLHVPRGSVFGLLGPNGAGKSTLVKSLLTIVRPTECRGSMLGEAIGHRKTLGKTGYLPEHARFPEYLTGREVIAYSAGLAGIPAVEGKRRIPALLELVGMGGWADKKLGTYSKGMRQRIGLAQALVNEPEIVFLDEPTDGVDPEGRIEIRKMIEGMREEGRTVFLNSHLLQEVEQVADQVAILVRGRVIESGPVEQLTKRGRRYEIRTQGPVPLELREKLLSHGIGVAGDCLSLDADDAGAIQPVIDALRAAGATIREIKEARYSLEEIFLQAVQGQGKEAA
ncbi:ABC transporter ATP-binding protein [Luteolibacter luteus]|uniref:ABC transporter ATP-binding protein n=1 Tax=Luteolibacter luteus TaxID=2728835 RepID=A0A858RSJ9_9BACT|nr:ABC transporter ATP-binding protein [Luteolibacter luteus]QJE98933.1 ABC transporter ATP-binding protein [Luteolibacter luteus]